MEHYLDKMVLSFFERLTRGARTIYEKPVLALILYLLALLGVFTTPLAKGQPGSGRAPLGGRRDVPGGPSAPKDPEAVVLRELGRARLSPVERDYQSGETIYGPGDPDDRIHFLLSGTVRIYRLYGDFKEATTGLLKDRGVFGGLDLMEGGYHEDFAEAMTASRVAAVRKSSVAWLVRRDPAVALSLFSAFSERMRQSDELVTSLLPREVSSRLAALLLNLSKRFGEEGETGSVKVALRLTHQDLANMIASTREAVSKAMSDFRRDGLIDVRDRRTVLLDRPGLADLAEGRSVDDRQGENI